MKCNGLDLAYLAFDVGAAKCAGVRLAPSHTHENLPSFCIVRQIGLSVASTAKELFSYTYRDFPHILRVLAPSKLHTNTTVSQPPPHRNPSRVLSLLDASKVWYGSSW